jgi:hypothetical protein
VLQLPIMIGTLEEVVAPLPIATVFVSVPADGPALFPIAVFPLPELRFPPAFLPITVFCAPDELEIPAPCPIKVSSEPVVLYPAASPRKVFALPLAFVYPA